MHLPILYLSTAVVFTTLLVAPPLQERFRPLVVIDAHDERARTDLAVTCKEGCPPAVFGNDGLGKLKLPADVQSGDSITLRITNQTAGGGEWVLISPWDGRVVSPRDAKSEIGIMVGRKGDRQILSSSK